MICLVIGASEESIHAICLAKKYGLEVWAYDNNPNAKGFDFADKSFVCDINKIDYIINTLHGAKPKLILPVPIGRALVSIGKLNDYWNLLGVRENIANILTDKYQFHMILNNYGLRDISCYLINGDQEIKENSFKEFPYILKPRFGSGSRNVCKIYNMLELKSAIMNINFDEDYVLEKAVEGIEFGVDGSYDNGQFNLILLRKKVITSPPAQQCIAYLSENYDLTILSNIKDIFQKLGTALNLIDGIMHADIILNNENIFIIEMSLRPSGHYLHNIFTPHVTGIDMVEEFIKKCIGSPYNFKVNYIKNSIIHFFNFENELINKIPTSEELIEKKVIDYKIYFNKGTFFEDIVKDGSVTKRGYFIIDSDNDLLKLSDEVLRIFANDSI